MISVAMLRGTEAAAYYLQRDAGCALDYYTDEQEVPGRWCGAGTAALGLTGSVDEQSGKVLGLLLDGCLPDGTRVAGQVLRADPRGLLPAARLVDALGAEAARVGVPVAELVGDARAAAKLAAIGGWVAAAPRGRPALVPADEAGRLAVAAGLDPRVVFHDADGTDRYAAALAHAGARVDRRRAGLDVVVSAPKSVSVLYALADPATAAAVVAAHDRAVAEALGYLERHASHGMRGHQGDGQRATRIGTAGFVAARFGHRTSRADDPQLHTHVVIANVLLGSDGRWSAVDSRAVHRQAKTAGCVYQAVLRGELTRTLGVGWGQVRQGVAEIAGIPEGVCREFSTRRRQIEADLDTSGGTSRAAAQAAAYRTRTAKTHTGEPVLRQQWAERVRALGHDPNQLLHAALAETRSPALPEVDEVARRLLGPDGLTKRATSFQRRDVVQAVIHALPPGVAVDGREIEAVADAVLTHRGVVTLLSAGPDDARRYTTAELLAVEQRALDLADQKSTAVPTWPAAPVDSWLAGHLSGEQRATIRQLLCSPAAVDVVVGPAGSGKTAALQLAAAAWQHAGVPVVGTAIAAVTARRLREAAGVPAMSLARLLAIADHADPATGHPAGLAPRTIVLVDEASMVGTRQLARLLEHVHAAGGKTVLVGDPAQLPEIDAGGLFAHLADHASRPAAVLTSNQRQAALWERAALRLLREGSIDPALAAYDTHDRIHLADTPEQVSTAIAEQRTASIANSGPYATIALASRTSDVRMLNTAIREKLRADGRLGPNITTVRDQHGSPLPLATGDLVMVTRNDLRAEIFNGTRGQVTELTPDRIQLRLEDGRTLDTNTSWADRQLTHAYALTVHKAQGLTVDTCLLYGTGALSQQAGYVGLSRGRQANHLYATTSALRADTGMDIEPTYESLGRADAIDRLADQLSVTRTHTLASQQRPDDDDLLHRLAAEPLDHRHGMQR